MSQLFQLTNYQIQSCLLRKHPIYRKESAVGHLEIYKGILSSLNDWHLMGRSQRCMIAFLEQAPYKELSCLKCQSIPIKEHWNTGWEKKKAYILHRGLQIRRTVIGHKMANLPPLNTYTLPSTPEGHCGRRLELIMHPKMSGSRLTSR